MCTNQTIVYSGKADFLVNGTYLFEVDGKNKGKQQIKNESNAYNVSDDIEVGFGNKIPLWIFGIGY